LGLVGRTSSAAPAPPAAAGRSDVPLTLQLHVRSRPRDVSRGGYDLQDGRFARHADAEREAVETRSPVHVEAAGAVAEQPVIRPCAAAEDRPVEAEAQETELPPVRVARERQVDVTGRDVPEDAWIVQEQEAEVSGAARMAGDEVLDVLATSPT